MKSTLFCVKFFCVIEDDEDNDNDDFEARDIQHVCKFLVYVLVTTNNH